MLDQRLNFIVGFTFYLHWLWRFSGAFTRRVGPQSAHMEHIVNTCKMPLQVKLVWSLAHVLEDLERAYKPLKKLTYSHQM